MKNNRLIIIDYYNFLYRAHYGIQARLTNGQGLPTNAIYGMASMVSKLIQEYKPSHLVVVKEGGKNWRQEVFADYKKNRSSMPAELKEQIVYVDMFFNLMNIPTVTVLGQEADDVMASLAKNSPCNEVFIATGDKDLYQMVNDKIKVVDTMKNKIYDGQAVFEKFGVYPHQVVDYLALVGDSSDNVPGAQGIGEKTAAKLIATFGGLSEILSNIDKITGKNKEKIEKSKENILLSQKLVTLNHSLIVDPILENWPGPQKEELNKFFNNLSMKSMVGKF